MTALLVLPSRRMISRRVMFEKAVSGRVMSRVAIPEKAIAEEVVSKEVTPEAVVSEKVLPKEVISGEITPEETVPEKAVPEEAVPEKAIAEEVVSKEVTPEAVVSEEPAPETTEPEEDDFFTRPTQPIMAVKPVTSKKETPSSLHVDRQGRPFVCSRNTVENTPDLVETLVEHFMAINGTVPTVIYLSAFRYFTYGMIMRYYYPRQIGLPRIPYEYEPGATYDVLVRGEVFDGN
jgi:hypothetical protein